MRLPAPMLARSAAAPPAGDVWRFELKLDGVRALVDTHDGLRVRSRRGWNMTALVPELEAVCTDVVLDGELVTPGDDGLMGSFPRVCQRLLFRDRSVPVVFLVFDVLAVDGMLTTGQPWSERRAILDELELAPPAFALDSFDDGEALLSVVITEGLEGIVAKRVDSTYEPVRRAAWVKVKNRDYWRRESELAATSKRRERGVQRHASGGGC